MMIGALFRQPEFEKSFRHYQEGMLVNNIDGHVVDTYLGINHKLRHCRPVARLVMITAILFSLVMLGMAMYNSKAVVPTAIITVLLGIWAAVLNINYNRLENAALAIEDWCWKEYKVNIHLAAYSRRYQHLSSIVVEGAFETQYPSLVRKTA